MIISIPTCVYILWSDQIDKFYVGVTTDINRRLAEHNSGKTIFMETGSPWKLMWVRWKRTKGEAIRLEQKLKNMKSSSRIRSFMDKYAEDKV